MLHRSAVTPFVRLVEGRLTVDTLPVDDARVVAFADRLIRLLSRLVGCPRATVLEALRRQERRVRDVARLRGLARTAMESCRFAPLPGAEHAPAIRAAAFARRAVEWPPLPQDTARFYRETAATLGLAVPDATSLVYADRPEQWRLVAAPVGGAEALLARYNLDLARGALVDAESMVFTARGGWRRAFSALRRARLMFTIDRERRAYRVTITGPAAAHIAHPARYGHRFARVLPALTAAPGWRVDATIRHADGTAVLRLDARVLGAAAPRGGGTARREQFDSGWERTLARAFRRSPRGARAGWTLAREATPLLRDGRIFLPHFTLRHADGREALVELVGFWTPAYLHDKLATVRAASDLPLVLLVPRALASTADARAMEEAVGSERVAWFTRHPRLTLVMAAVERIARRPHGRSSASSDAV
ncbi:MAG: DUF790 family protein [Gemmatimonadaceae bacterium]|nr:DUF790 family protein [Gemmatimonadaceae bacterium]